MGKLVSCFNQLLAEIQEDHVRWKQHALNDELTGLPNRRLLADHLSQALATVKGQQNTVAVIYMDLDWLTPTNDSLRHSVGDLLPREVADRLGQRVRASDTFARTGGNELTVIATSVRNAKEAADWRTAVLWESASGWKLRSEQRTGI